MVPTRTKNPPRTGHKWLLQHVYHTGDGCLAWPFTVGGAGYGQFSAHRKFYYAHRYMCELAHGPAPSDGHQAAHSCGNTECVNPRHLSWKTPAENQLDRRDHGTTMGGRRHKLTPEQVAEIRAAAGTEPRARTAARYGVTGVTVRHIQNGNTWKTGAYAFGGFQVAPWRKGRPGKRVAIPSTLRTGD
jgi:hypothetical protein